jgi:hypothetical protein
LYWFIVLVSKTAGGGTVAVSILSLIILFLRRQNFTKLIIVGVFLVPVGFYVFSLYSGQAIIFVPELNPLHVGKESIYNTRYGTLAMPSLALLTAILSAYITPIKIARLPDRFRGLISTVLRRYRYLPAAICVLAIVVQSIWITVTGVISLQDGQFGYSCFSARDYVDHMARYYDGGRILVDMAGNATAYSLGPVAGIDFKNIIYQGSAELWQQALQNPVAVADWIILNPATPADRVAKAMDLNGLGFRIDYVLVSQDPNGARLYRRNGFAEGAERPVREDALIDNQLCV